MPRDARIGTLIVLCTLVLVACAGSQGPQGPPGPAGPPGPEGPQGPPGEAAEAAAAVTSTATAGFVGSSTCSACHQDTYNLFLNSGHNWKLNPVVDGQPPQFPFTEVPDPPAGYTWADISYVIGGYNWKARFIDQDGYILTGDEDATTQYNFANPEVGNQAGWVAYHPGEEIPYDCGTCHTTGYSPRGNQDALPGLIGTWAEPGIQCEACHGHGSLHITNPQAFQMQVDRDAEQCGQCHIRGSIEEVNASGGFIQHHEQYEEIFQSKHVVLDCVLCHDPHVGVIQLQQMEAPTTRTQCENCHFQQAKFQASQIHPNVAECIDCHMPRLVRSAVGDAERFIGDIRTHIVAIDPDQVGQFSEDGSVALSQISLDFACRSCHIEGGSATPKSDEQLIEKATGYHERP